MLVLLVAEREELAAAAGGNGGEDDKGESKTERRDSISRGVAVPRVSPRLTS